MSQRDSGYQRKERDLYETPEWATEAVLPHLPIGLAIWEPAAATGKMARVLQAKLATDIDAPGGNLNFLTQKMPDGLNAIITNPPYELAQEFIQHALQLTNPAGLVGMLLRTDYDHAASRQHLFSRCKQFKKKLVLTKRIKWFENSDGQPSFNHAWFLWDWKHDGPPTLAYGPEKASLLSLIAHQQEHE